MNEVDPLLSEIAAILEGDIRTRLGDQPITKETLTAALIESMQTLDRPIDKPMIHVERDPNDPNRLIVHGLPSILKNI